MKKLSEVVYSLIYPAILGSMLYDVLPYNSSLLYLIQVFILVFYLFDYCNLYLIMRNKFSKEQQLHWTYVVFDLLVSIALFIAFKYSSDSIRTENAPNIYFTIWGIATVPMFFLLYSIRLKYNRVFYVIFSAACLLSAFIISRGFDINNQQLNEKNVFYFIAGMTVVYGIYIISQNKKKLVTNKITDNND